MKIKNDTKLKLGMLSIAVILSTQLSGSDHNATKEQNATSTASSQSSINIQDKIVATVNGKPIYQSKLDKLVNKQLRKDKKFKSVGSSDLDRKIVKKVVLKKLIDDELLIQESLKNPSQNADKKVDEEIEKITKRFGGVEKYKKYLPHEMNDKEFRDYLKKRIMVRAYLKNEGVIDPNIPEEKIKNFYNKKKSNFRSEELVKVSQILLLVKPTDSLEKKKKVLEKAKKIKQRLIKGEDFAKLAKEFSQSAEANATGGDLGIIRKGYMPKEFDKAAFSMKKGEISDPIETKFGYHIIKLTDKREARTASYEESRDFIRKFLQERETIKKMDSLMKRLRKNAKIEILDK